MTQVIVDEDNEQVGYELDEALIGFGAAVDESDLLEAMRILESQASGTPEILGMWRQLSDLALMEGNLLIAERCASALGNVARSRFLRKINKLISSFGSSNHWLVKARLAMLRKDFDIAAHIFVDQGKIDKAIEMYRDMNRWDKAIEIAERNDHPDAKDMRDRYLKHLVESGQEEKAAELKERENDYLAAISLYLRAGLPARAAGIVDVHPGSYSPDLLEEICTALCSASLHVQAGAIYERLNRLSKALDCYVKGHGFRNAVSLARASFPGKVVWLEEAWADWLSSQGQTDAAINHYIEAGVLHKAVEAAIRSNQWQKAIQLVEDTMTDEETARPFYLRIAQHYASSLNFSDAERCYLKADRPELAVRMYTSANRWDEAHSVAMSYMSESEVANLYVSQARRMEATGNLEQAEKLYLKVKEADLAINMYKKARRYEDMVRLVSTYRKDHLKETHRHLAQQMEMEGSLKDAEHHYTQSGEWQSAVNMYRANDMWDEAIRVAKYNGGVQASKQVAYAWAMTLGGEAGAKLLRKLGLIEQAIDYAIERRSFDHAFELARNCMKKKIPEVHLKHALYLEDEERFKEAEEEFIKAGKPKEAIDMFLHQQDWDNAMRVAEQYDPSNISDVLVSRGVYAQEQKNYQSAENFFVDAKKPEKALRMYQDLKMWIEAIRVAKMHLPHKLHAVNMARQRSEQASFGGNGGNGGDKSSDSAVSSARMWEQTGDYSRAIDAYMSISEKNVSDERQIAKIWLKAVQIASIHRKDRFESVSRGVAQRLVSIRQHARAAVVYRDAERYKEAIDCFVQAGDWDSARDLSRTSAKEYRDYVEKAYRNHLVSSDNAQGVLDTGDVKSGLEMFARRGQWQKVFEICRDEKPEVRGRYAYQNAVNLVDKGKPFDAIKVLAKHGASSNTKYLDFYKDLTVKILSIDSKTEEKQGSELYGALRTVLFDVLSGVRRRGDSSDGSSVKEFQRLLMTSHLCVLRLSAIATNQRSLAAKISISLLRECGTLPWDKAFAQAGSCCADVNWQGLSYMFYNRFIDILDAMEDNDTSTIENTDFADTTIPSPMNMRLPKFPYADEDQSEEIRNKVLAWALDDDVDSEESERRLREMLDWASSLTSRFNRSLAGWLTENGSSSSSNRGHRDWDNMHELKQLSRLE